jgi:hypothetical protein
MGLARNSSGIVLWLFDVFFSLWMFFFVFCVRARGRTTTAGLLYIFDRRF